MKSSFQRVLAFLALALAPALLAEVEKNEDGTFTISGSWTFWEDKDLLAPSGRENNFGDYKMILFKQATNDFEGIRQMKQTPATFIVSARESKTPEGENILIVEQILKRE